MGCSATRGISVHLVDLPQMLEDAVRDALVTSVLLIEPRACDAALVELWPSRRSLGSVDAAAIAAAVRSAADWRDRWARSAGANDA